MAIRKGRRESPVSEAQRGALNFSRGWVKCMIHFLLLEINLLSSQHLPDSNRSSCSGHLQFQKLSAEVILSWMLKHQCTPPAQGREQWERESVWPLIASSEYKCLCASEHHTLILLQRKGSRHTCVHARTHTHTQTGCLISVIGTGGQSSRRR